MKTIFQLCAAVMLVTALVNLDAQQDYKPSADLESLHVPFDALLDTHVRDGLVYYRALQDDRARLSRYIASLNAPAIASAYTDWPADQKEAFWLNAYNALGLPKVVRHYP